MSAAQRGAKKGSRSNSRDPKHVSQDERLEKEHEAAQRKREDEPLDVMAKKGYYDEMVQQMEAMKIKIRHMDEEIEAEEGDQKQLQVMVSKMQQWLAKHEPEIEEKKKKVAALDRQIAELEARDPNVESESARGRREAAEAQEAARKQQEEMEARAAQEAQAAGMARASMLQRATTMRSEFRDAVLRETAPLQFGLSATPRGGGVEAVEICSLAASSSSGVQIPVRCYSPAGKPFNASPAPPAIVYLHGGGYVMGDLDTHDWLCRSLAAMAGSTVVCVDYRRAPEHKYPAAVDDAYAALVWVARGGLGAQPRRVGIAGDCAGGGLAAACCLRAKADPEGPQIAVQLLAYPWLDLRPDAASMSHEFADGRHGLSREECAWNRQAYAPPGANPDGGGFWTQEVNASPLLAESLAGLPRAFVVYPVNSMLAQESVSFVERIRKEVGPEAVHTMRVENQRHHFALMANDHQTQHVVFAAATFASALLWA